MNICAINSIKDPLVMLARELTTGAGRNKHRKFLLFGQEQIEWALQADIAFEAVFCVRCPNFLQNTQIPVFETTEGILKKISDTSYLVPLLAIAQYPDDVKHGLPDFAIVLDNVVDFGNIGTIIRTAQSFFIDTFVFSTDGDPFQRKVIDSSRGLVFRSNFEAHPSVSETIQALKSKHYQIVVTSPYAQTLQSQVVFSSDRPIALIVGNETHGVDKEFEKHADFTIQVPMAAHVESLNVGVFTGISIYELKFKQVLTMLKEKIFTNFGREINIAGTLVKMAFDKKISQVTEFSGMQVILLMIMHCDESMARKQIAKDVGLFGDDLEQFLASLVDKKLIAEQQPNMFIITAAGKQFLAEIWPIVEQTDQLIFKNFSVQEKQQFLDFLKSIQNSCSDIIGIE
jgi:RNA methyltransferase, TrmH family